MATSTKASTFLQGTELRFPEGTEKFAIELLIAWLKSTTLPITVKKFPIPLQLAQAITICRTATLIGLDRYTEHIVQFYRHIINRKGVTDEMLTLVEAQATPDDPFVYFVADRLAYKIRHGLLTDHQISGVAAYPMINARLQGILASWKEHQHPEAEEAVCQAESTGLTREDMG
jgi:hypothetical protein